MTIVSSDPYKVGRRWYRRRVTASLDDAADRPDSASSPRSDAKATREASSAKPSAVKKTAAKKPATQAAGAADKTTAPVKKAAPKASSSKTSSSKASTAAKTATTAKKATATAAKKTAAASTAKKTTAASAAKNEESKNVAAKKTATAKSAAAKTTAAKSAAARSAATKTQSSTAAAKTTASRAVAAKATVAKTTAAKTTASKATAKTTATKTTAAKAEAAKTAAAKAEAAKTAAAKAAATRAAKAEVAKKPLIAADDAAATVEAVPAPANEPAAVESVAAESPAGAEAAPAVEVAEILESEPAAELEPAAEPETGVAEAENAVVVRGLAKHFGDHRAVNGIDLTIPAGSFYGIVGPNGAGKTTTLSILAGLLRADSGQVSICGIDQAKDSLGAKRVMGVLPDRLRTFDRLTGRQLLHYYGLLRGLSAEAIEKRSSDLIRAFDLSSAVGRVVSDYSAGMTKKIMLAGAMIHSPRVLVLDEPFESVDPVSSAVILDILRAYVAHGGTVVLSSHGMDLVEQVCSRVAIIVGGDVLAEGTVDEVRAGQTLESRFVELSGGIGEVEGLEWLHTFSD
jgi:ABC-type multidrug transport system ATPase subunit